MGMAAQWQDSFDTLFRKARQLRESTLQATFTAERLAAEIAAVTRQRQAMDRVDHQLVSWLEADVLADAAGEVELRIDYVVPNALWRPLHTARLLGRNRVQVTSSAAVWQETGEDWKDVELRFSTARSSLGTEPPMLHAGSAQREEEERGRWWCRLARCRCRRPDWAVPPPPVEPGPRVHQRGPAGRG